MVPIANVARMTTITTGTDQTRSSTAAAPANSATMSGVRIRPHITEPRATRYGVTGPTPIASSNAKAIGMVARS